MALSLLKTVGGILLLTAGAELLVRVSVSLARRAGMSPLIVALTVVSVGTSMPELVVSFDAIVQGSAALGIGNVVGSNISNIALILGVAALVHPMHVEAQVVRLDGPILVAVSVVFVLLILDGTLGHLDGGMLMAGVAGYLSYSVWAVTQAADAPEAVADGGWRPQHTLLTDLGFLTLGIGGLVGGADILVHGALQIAHVLQVPDIFIGLTVVAVGTSLPELATSVMAAYRGKGDIAIGNAVGSCILNILGILGVTALVHPLATASLTAFELITMVGVAVLLLPLLRTNFILSRIEGAVLLAVYGGYLGVLVLGM